MHRLSWDSPLSLNQSRSLKATLPSFGAARSTFHSSSCYYAMTS